MKFGFIGAGRAGTAVAGYFKQHGLEVTGFFNRSLDAAVESAVITDAKTFLSLDDLIAQSDVLVIAVSDDAIRKFAVELCKRNLDGKIICHLSGCLPAACLDAGAGETATCLVLHPLAAFVSKQPPAMVSFSLEGTGPRAEELLKTLKQHGIAVFPMTPDQLSAFYLAMSFLNPFVVTLIGIARDILRSVGIHDISPFQDMLTQVYRSALAGHNIRDIMSGPIATEDSHSIKQQMQALNAFPQDIAHLFLQLATKSMAYSRLDNYAKLRICKILQANM